MANNQGCDLNGVGICFHADAEQMIEQLFFIKQAFLKKTLNVGIQDFGRISQTAMSNQCVLMVHFAAAWKHNANILNILCTCVKITLCNHCSQDCSLQA